MSQLELCTGRYWSQVYFSQIPPRAKEGAAGTKKIFFCAIISSLMLMAGT